MRTLTLTEVAEELRVSRKTMYNMIQSGRFPVPPIKGTKPRRWDAEAVKAWVQESSERD